jgi:hypothetical protein
VIAAFTYYLYLLNAEGRATNHELGPDLVASRGMLGNCSKPVPLSRVSSAVLVTLSLLVFTGLLVVPGVYLLLLYKALILSNPLLDRRWAASCIVSGLLGHGLNAHQLEPQSAYAAKDAVEVGLVDDFSREDRLPTFGLHLHPFEG